MTEQPPAPQVVEPDSEEDERLLEIEEEIEPLGDDDLDKSLEPPAPIDPEAVEEQERKATTLVGRLAGIKHRTRKVLLFTDADAINALAHTNAMIQRYTDAIGQLGPVTEKMTDEEVAVHVARRDALTGELDALENTLEPVKALALKSALAVYLVGYPAIATKVARRAAYKMFVDPATKKIPEERAEEFSSFIENFLLGSCVLKIVDSDGDELELPKRSEIGQVLEDMLPAPQWERLKLNFMQLNVEDQISQTIQDDPGF